jgi:transcriptional regulator with XRE-family HTH domain
MRTINRARNPWAALGKEIVACRERRAWLQTNLAKRLNVGQQTVSRWENGSSRPTESVLSALATLLPDHSIEEWRALAGYVQSQSAPVAAPLLPDLPLASLQPDRFEDFCRDLISALYPRARVNRFGAQGDTQYGIDIEAVLADGERHGFQCKRHLTFGPDKVRSAMKELKIGVDQAVILLSRPATAAARLALGKSRKWSIWDSTDIARKARQDLTKDQASILIDTYFPGLRAGFLGIPDPSPFLTPERFFAPFLKHSIFSHAWTLVGRTDVVTQISALLEKDKRAVVLVHGSGGIGKSRTIMAVCNRFQADNPAVSVRIVDAKLNVSPKDLELLRGRETLLVVDDAHDRSDLQILFELVARSESPVRLLVVTRPFARPLIQADLSRLAMLTDEHIIGLKRLQRDEVKALSREILSKLGGQIDLAAQIADATSDSPLATVVGSYLVATKRVHPSVFANEDTFRTHLYRSFEEAITGDLGRPDESETVKDVLGLFSLVQPADIDHPGFRSLAERVVGKPIDKIVSVVTRLHESGVLLKRGRRLRITPDLLAEYILQDRCVSLNRTSSGYAERVASQLDADLLHNVIVNLSRLDWRISQGSTDAGDIVDPLWSRLLEQFRDEPAVREPIAKAISEAAFYQPKRALAFADMVMNVPEFRSEEIPQLLKRVAYNYSFLGDACVRLWELGKNDQRALHQHPYHPIRILSELAAVEVDKPIVYCESTLDFVVSALADNASHQHAYSLFDVIEAALAPDGHQTTSRGYTVTFKPFAVNLAAAKAVRQKAIDAVLKVVSEGKAASATRAAHALHAALRYPMHGPIDQRSDWTDEFVRTLGAVEKIFAERDLDPVVVVALQKSIAWHVSHGEAPAKKAAEKALAAVKKSLKYQITMNLLDGWGDLRLRGIDNFDATQERIATDAKATVRAMHTAFKEPNAIREVLEERFAVIALLRQSHNNPGFVATLVESNVAIGKSIWDAALKKGASYPLVGILDNILGVLIEKESAWALAVSRKALTTGVPELARAVAFAYGWRRRGANAYGRDEIALIGDLMRHPDEVVNMGVVRALENIAANDRAQAVSLLLELDLTKSDRLVHETFMVLMHNQPLKESIKEKAVFGAILAKLHLIHEIDDHWVTAFLREGSSSYPQETLNFLLGRIEHERAMRDTETRDYDAIPWLWANNAELKFRDHPEFPAIISKIVDWMKGKKDWLSEKRGAVLFAAAVGGYDDVTLNALAAPLASPDPTTVLAASSLLTEAPRTLVFTHVPFVSALLAHSHALGIETYRSVGSDLWSAAISGVKSGSPGKPFPEDIAMRDKAEEVLKALPKGSPAWRFYSDLKGEAESFIKMERRHMPDEFAEDEE